MSKTILILLIIFTCLSLSAVQQGVEDAWQVANNFVNSHLLGHQISNQLTFRAVDGEKVYIFETTENGFIAVSGDDIFPPVIAYSIHNSIAVQDNQFVEMIQKDLANRRRYYSINFEKAASNQAAWTVAKAGSRKDRDFQQWPPEGSTNTDGWVETTWNQSGVYNRFCPLDNSGERSVVGCTATAMSMIMDFHRWIGDPSFGNYDDYYTWNEGMAIDNDHEERDFPSFSELNVYLDDVVNHYADGVALTDDDKAALCFAAGVSVEMDYSSTGSGAWGVVWPLLNKFGYDSATEVEGDDWNLYNIMIDNMQHMRPGELAIYSETSGHAIIVDGYNSDDFYHLNYGWGTSNNTCWYSLPNGMPSGYTIIASCILEIEGGDVPVEVTGDISVDGIAPEGAEVNLYGERYSYRALADEDGLFQLPAVLEGTYTVEAILDSRVYYYYEENVSINEVNNELEIQLGNFDAVTGDVTAPVNTENSAIRLYQYEELVYQGITNADGQFSIPDVLPGIYRVTASLEGQYYQENEIEITLENQTMNFELQEYPGVLGHSFGTSTAGIWSLVPGFTLGCAIKLTGEELFENGSDIITGVNIKAPFDSDTGWINAQLWEEDLLIGEVPIPDFTQGEWISCDLGSYIKINPAKDYFVGYEAYSESGQFAWHDETPRVVGKGAFFNHSGWVELQPDNFNFNFCIEARLGSQEFGIISGSVDINYSTRELSDVVVKAGTNVVHLDEEGNFELLVKYGTYDLQAFLDGETSNIISGITVSESEPFTVVGELELLVSTDVEDDLPEVQKFVRNYPNPFNLNNSSRNSQLTITFNIGKISRESNKEEVEIYNIRGQKVRVLSTENHDENGTYKVFWDGNDNTGRTLPSGIYFSKIKSRDIQAAKILLIK